MRSRFSTSAWSLLVLAVAAWTIVARDGFAAVVGFVAYGLLLALVWVRLAAPDVALTEAAIGSGVTGGLLLARLRAPAPQRGTAARERPGATLRVAAALASALRRGWPRRCRAATCRSGARRSRRQAAANLPATGLGNAVTGGADGLPRDRHDAREGRAAARAGRRLVAGAGPALGRRAGAAAHRAEPDGALAFLAQVLPPVGHRRRHPHLLGRRAMRPVARSRVARSSPRCGFSP